ncbi:MULTISPECIES: nitroreductase family protein [Chryseobacterium]|uniref:nitroreductase family protein n=1 Tax=Chryseobacterium sp. R2A-55 TaxID=2744445 RepID=UPI001F2DD042|nr:nitroreductase family protein [Chryseobacterium sp. R2A-55]
MSLEEILQHRRSVRHYDPTKEIDSEWVKECIQMATLAPNSSNMQLWEFYHITDHETLKKLSRACLDQESATTAKQMVVFVTRQDLHRKHARKMMELEVQNVLKNSPNEKHEKRSSRWKLYYGTVMPFLYTRFFGIAGFLRKIFAYVVNVFRPMILEVSENDARVVVHKTCALAAQTFMLAMSEKGYDTCPMEGFDSRRVKRILNLPMGAEINMVVSCGIRMEKGVWGDRMRLPFEEVYRRV